MIHEKNFFLFGFTVDIHVSLPHFNENVQRATQVSKNGEAYIKVTYPKFKLGEEVMREVAVTPTYGE